MLTYADVCSVGEKALRLASLLYMRPRATAVYVSSYYCYMCPHTTAIYVSSYYYICVSVGDNALRLASLLYMCPDTAAIYVSSYYYICVLILLNTCLSRRKGASTCVAFAALPEGRGGFLKEASSATELQQNCNSCNRAATAARPEGRGGFLEEGSGSLLGEGRSRY